MVPPGPCIPDSCWLPGRSTSTVPAHTVRAARPLGSDGDSSHSQHLPPEKTQTRPFPPKNPAKPKTNNKTQQQQQPRGKKPNKQTKERKNIYRCSKSICLAKKKKVGTESGWAQPVISGKKIWRTLSSALPTEGFFKSFYLLSHLYKKKALEKYSKACTFKSWISSLVQRLCQQEKSTY